jgi:hypothetical protein
MMAEKPIFDGSEPVDDYLNEQTKLRMEKEKADKHSDQLMAAHGGPGGSMDIVDYETKTTVGDLMNLEEKKSIEADHQARKNIRKKLGIPETSGVDDPHQYEKIEEIEDPPMGEEGIKD